MSGKTLNVALVLAVIVLGVAVPCPRVHAEQLPSAVLGVFPKDTTQISSIDLQAAHRQPWFELAQHAFLPLRLRKIEQFLASAGMPVDSQLDEIAWGTLPAGQAHGEPLLGVGFGHFSPSTVENYFHARAIRTWEFQGFELMNFNRNAGGEDLYMAFLDPETLVFGGRDAVEHMIRVRFREEENADDNPTLLALSQSVNINVLGWVVSDQQGAQLPLEELLPSAARGADVSSLSEHIKAIQAEVSATSSLDAQLRLICSSPADALAIVKLLQAASALGAAPSAENMSPQSLMLAKLQLSARGSEVLVEISLSDEEIASMLQANFFMGLAH